MAAKSSSNVSPEEIMIDIDANEKFEEERKALLNG
jgi:hypothetical protein